MLSRRWIDPFEEMRSIIDEMDRMMEEFWSTGIEPSRPARRGLGRRFVPQLKLLKMKTMFTFVQQSQAYPKISWK